MKVLPFTPKVQDHNVTSFSPETSEVISVNFRKGEVFKTVETSNVTGRVMSSFEMRDLPTPFMGEGFGEIVNILLKKQGVGA